MMRMREMGCGAFLDALAAKTPAPGGGGASALMGALGVALACMVGRYTVGKPRYAAVEAEVQGLLERAEKIRTRLVELIDEDAAAFEPLSRAYAIPKEDPSRGEIMERCLRSAAAPPMEMLRLACQAIEIHRELLEKGSVMVRSDVGTGVIACWGALYGAALNVKVNTKGMADRAYADEINAQVDALMEKYWKMADEVYESVFRGFS